MYEPCLGWINNFLLAFLHEKRRKEEEKSSFFVIKVLRADYTANIKSELFDLESSRRRLTKGYKLSVCEKIKQKQ